MKSWILAAGLLCLAGVASAEESAIHGIGVRAGTDGIGLSYGYALNRHIGLRAGYNFGAISHDFDEQEIDYTGRLRFKAFSAIVDYKPFAGAFRISAGYYSAPPEFTLKASGEDEYELGDGERYYGNLRLDGDIDLGSGAPYLGLGWGGNHNRRGLGVSFDVGVLFTQSPEVSLTASGTACEGSGPCAPGSTFDVDGADPRAAGFRDALRREIADIEDDAEDFKLWPVINLGLHYRF